MSLVVVMTRYALVKGTSDEVAAYLPSNYRVIAKVDDEVVIAGEDQAGWTLDEYVLPRLASGLHFGHEIDHAGDVRGDR